MREENARKEKRKMQTNKQTPNTQAENKSGLILTAQIKNEILTNGLDLEKTTQQLAEICANMDEPVNHIRIDLYADKVAPYLYVFPYSVTETETKGTKYFYLADKYHESKGWKVAAHLADKRELLNNLIDNAIQTHEFKAARKPQSEYIIKKLENNKPLTLLKAKNNNFIVFVVFGKYRAVNELDINDDKKAAAANFFNISNNCAYKAEQRRKDAEEIFAVYNKHMAEYRKSIADDALKREQRKNNKEPKELKKYYYTDQSFLNDLLGYKTELNIYNGFSHNSLLKHEFDTVDAGTYIRYMGKDYPKTTAPTTRRDIFNKLVDKSGYFVFDYQYKLQQRAEQLRIKRKKDAEEKRRADFIASDKSEFINNINRVKATNKAAIIKLLNYDFIMKDGALTLLTTLKDNIKDLEEMAADLNKYARYEDPSAKIESEILRIKELYIIALTKFNNSALDWCSADCYKIEGGEVVARYSWIGSAGCHADEVVRCPVNINF